MYESIIKNCGVWTWKGVLIVPAAVEVCKRASAVCANEEVNDVVRVILQK